MNGSSRRGRSQSLRKGQPRRRAGAGTKTKLSAWTVGTTSHSELLSQFGARVRADRDAAKVAQDKPGAAAGDIGQPYAAAIDGGAINPTLVTIANIAAALGVAIRVLV